MMNKNNILIALSLAFIMQGALPKHQKIKQKIADFYLEDQEIRKRLSYPLNEDARVILEQMNKDHIAFVKDILKNGWPKISEFSQETCQQIWLLVQHCPDIEFQKKCLEQMKVLDRTEIDISLIAYLHDRVHINSGLPQIYGTQIDENFNAVNLEDPENVDIRRASMGLPPLHEYLEFCEKSMRSFFKE